MKKIFKLNVFTPLQILFLSLRNSVFVTGFIFMLSLSFFLSVANAEPNISMDFQDANLKDILKVFSMQSGLNFIASEAVQERKITLYLDKVPLGSTMDKLFKANNLSYELDKEANIFTVKDWGKPQIETVTKVFNLKYATVSSSPLKAEISANIGKGEGGGEDSGITQAVKKILSEYGSVIEDARTNSLIVMDIPSRLPTIAQTIAALDAPVAQVMLEVEMLDVSKNTVDKMGVNWGGAGSFSIKILSATRGTYFPLPDLLNTETAGQTKTTTAGLISFPTPLQLILDFLRVQTDTKYLARPRLLTLNNETAEIKIVTQESVGVTTSTDAAGNSSATVERAETGVSLRVTPQVNLESGEVTMFIYPKVSEAVTGNSFSTYAGSYVFRDPEERSTKSMVRIKDGDTVVVGGLIRNEYQQTTTKIPILGDLPLIGALFRHKGGGSTSSDKNRQRELLVFITPHIITDATIKLAQAKKTTLPEREQNTVSAIDRQGIINTSLNSFERKKK